MDYKIWKSIKIKRLRVPDLRCLTCGTRVEARAKTQLEISMSHSLSDPDCGWDKGLNDRAVVALSICAKTGDGPTEWQANPLIQFVSAAALRKTFAANQVVTEKPKGAGEGFELRVTWPSAVASSDGVVHALSSERIQFKREPDQRTISLALSKKSIPLQPLVKVGDTIVAGQIIASSWRNTDMPAVRRPRHALESAALGTFAGGGESAAAGIGVAGEASTVCAQEQMNMETTGLQAGLQRLKQQRPNVWVIKNLFSQVIYHLLENATKYGGCAAELAPVLRQQLCP